MDVYLVTLTWMISDQYGTSGKEIIGIYDSHLKARDASDKHDDCDFSNRAFKEYLITKFKLNGE